MKRLTMIPAALLCASLAACGPDLSSPEACVKSYQAAVLDQQNADGDEMLARWKWEVDCEEAALAWRADKTEAEKQLKKDRARYDFVRANLSTLRAYEIEIVGVSDQKDGDSVVGKKVEVRTKRKDIKSKGDTGTEFELKDADSSPTAWICTQIEGKWKIKSRRH